MQQEIIIATISIVVATLIASPLLISNVYAHGVTGKTVILSDGQGNWNPDGTRTSWTIVDPDFSPLTSTVLVNIKSYPDYNVCNVDYMYGAGAFSVTCITHHRLGEPNNVCCSVGGPANGAELHYTIFNPSLPLPVGGLA
jgi:hypothetical protein